MQNITRISDNSKSFLATIRSGSVEQNKIIALSLAQAVAKMMPLPSSVVQDDTQYYKDNVFVLARSTISQINELYIIDTRMAIEFTYMLWKARYRTLYPSGKVFLSVTNDNFTNALAVFLGCGNVLSDEILMLVDKEYTKLFPLINGFSQLVTELIIPQEVTNPEAT